MKYVLANQPGSKFCFTFSFDSIDDFLNKHQKRKKLVVETFEYTI